MSFTKIRIDPADAAFSRYVRLTHKRCEYCGKAGQGPEGIHGLELSHFYGRRHEGLRYSLLNCSSLCSGCHRRFTENPLEYVEWQKKKLGPLKFAELQVLRTKWVKKDRQLQAIIWRQAIKELNL